MDLPCISQLQEQCVTVLEAPAGASRKFFLKGQTFSPDVLAEKYSELKELETMQAHCKDVIYDASNFEDYDWKDAVWLGHLRIGHSEGIANK